VPRPKGLPKTGGRQKGVANKRTREIAARAATCGLTPLEYMLSVLRDSSVEPERRDRMAVAAAPYIHARLAAVEAKVATFGQVDVNITREQLAEQARREIDEAFREWQPKEYEGHSTRPLLDKPVMEQRSASAQDGDHRQPVAEADRPALPAPREFAAPGSFEAVPGVARLPVPRYRRPRPVGSGWAG
jgi:hypothetical protein